MSQGAGANKTKESFKCIICNYYYFLKVKFRFCHSSYDLMQKAMSFNEVFRFVSVKRNNYRINCFAYE